MEPKTSPSSSNPDRDSQPANFAPQPHRRARTRARISAACVRCQKRKIRCDGVLPSCSGCQKAGVRCVDGGTSREIPRNYLTELESRVAWLESVVRERCPDVDLTTGPGRPSRAHSSAVERGQRQGSSDSPEETSPHELTEQIGLISISGGSDLRYLGPSSGLFFTKFVLAGLSHVADIETVNLRGNGCDDTDVFLPGDLVDLQAKDFPNDKRQAMFLTQIYFDSVHLQFPFLHEPSHHAILHKLYNGETLDALEEFQAFMVLAVGATIYGRRSRRHMLGEGYYASALQRLDTVFRTPSLATVQCLLLLEMYTLHDPSSGLNLWTLHYHSLASCLELGLHRDVRNPRHFNPLQVELRTRIFWCTYTMNRQLCTIMGRPLGFFDEQCDLRLPMDVNDDDLTEEGVRPSTKPPGSFTTMSSAIHLFKWARFSSEIKTVLFCTDRFYPPYMTPAINDVTAWRTDMISRLRKWRQDIPRHAEGERTFYLIDLCEIRYHELMMLMLRPNPLFKQPSKAALGECFTSAITCSKLYAKLYADNQLRYGWLTVHSLFLCIMTIFYCVWTPEGIADQVNFDCLTTSLKAASDVLSATGEYWPEAKRSRDVLDRIFTATMRRFSPRPDYPKLQPLMNSSDPQPGSGPASVGMTDGTSISSQAGSSNYGDNVVASGDALLTSADGIVSSGVDHGEADLNLGLSMADGSPAMNAEFPYPSTTLDSFMSTDWLSYFMNAEDFGGMNLDTGFGGLGGLGGMGGFGGMEMTGTDIPGWYQGDMSVLR
ncbi:fungal-specific transcription factor domain-containing protein [Trichoderma sp. SZMC 28011]